MNWSLYLGRFFDVRIYMHWTFLLLLAWIFFAEANAKQSINAGFLGVLFICLLFACVVLHEFGHILTARKFKIKTRSITLLPIGGLARMESLPEKPRQELLVAIAGPMVNVAIAVIIYVALKATGTYPLINSPADLAAAPIWFHLFIANVVLFVFNLIPAFPMDGGRILRALLSFKLNRARATAIAATIGQALAIFFVFLGFFYNVWLIFIGIFVYLGAGAESNFEATKDILGNHKVADAVMHHYMTLQETDTLKDAVTLLLNGQEEEFLVMFGTQVTGILTRQDIIKGLSKEGQSAMLKNVMQSQFRSFLTTSRLKDVYQQMQMENIQFGPVFDPKGSLVGIIDRTNIAEFIMIKSAINS